MATKEAKSWWRTKSVKRKLIVFNKVQNVSNCMYKCIFVDVKWHTVRSHVYSIDTTFSSMEIRIVVDIVGYDIPSTLISYDTKTFIQFLLKKFYINQCVTKR